VPGAPGLYFAAITVQLAGLLREIGLESRAIGAAVAADVSAQPSQAAASA